MQQLMATPSCSCTNKSTFFESVFVFITLDEHKFFDNAERTRSVHLASPNRQTLF